jgi:VCBS repeat-containing protein
MTATRRVHIFAVLLLAFVPVLASAATHEFRVLIDADNNSATGCALSGMNGVDHVVVTLVRTEGATGAVERSYRLTCAGTSFGPQLDLDTTGWGVGYNQANGGMLVENRISYASLGGLPNLMRLGFDALSGGVIHSALAQVNGSPILVPGRGSKRHAVRSGGSSQRFFQLDGNGDDWGAINPVVTGIASSGNQSVRMHHGYAFPNATDEFIYFRIDANIGAAPYAEDDEFEREPGQNLAVTAPGVLANDGDPNNQPITAQPLSDATHGSVTLNADGSFTYTPVDPTSHQSDSFQYKVTNGTQDSNPARVTIKVSVGEGPDDNPVVEANHDNYPTTEDTPLTVGAPGVLGNDFPPSAASKASKLTDPFNGTVTVNEDGSFTYTPSANFFGTDTFQYTLTHPSGTDTATVTITVESENDAPTVADAAFSIDENSPAGTPVGSVSASDVDGDGLTYAITGGNTGGTFAISGTGLITVANNTLLDYEMFQSFTLTVTVTDDGVPSLSTDAQVVISLNDLNDPPAAQNDNYTTNEDQTLNVPAGTGLLANDTDPDGDSLSATKLTDPANGVATVASNGSFTYQPNPNFSGTDSFTYELSDGTSSDTATVFITVTGINDAPVNTVPAGQTTPEDTSLLFVSGIGISVADVDAGASNVQVTLTVTNGTLTLTSTPAPGTTGNGTSTIVMTAPLNVINNALINLRFDPAPNFNSPSSGQNAVLTIVTNDLGNTGTGGPLSDTDTVTIVVSEVNDAPVAVTDAIATAEDTPNAFAATLLSANDSPGPSNESTQTLTVTGVSATSAQGGTVMLVAGVITYSPAANFNGADSFTYTVTDNGTTNGAAAPLSSVGTVNVNVTEVNDAPVANGDAITAVEDTPNVFAASTLTTNDTAGPANESAQTLTVTAVVSPTTQGGTVSLAAGNITYTPPAGYNGPDSFQYTVTDNGTTNGAAAPLSVNGTVNVTVSEVNDLPVAADDAKTTAEDTPLAFPATDLTANDTAGPANENTQTLTVTSVVSPTAQGGTVSLNAGNITYTPPPDYFGADSFQYTVADNGTTNGAADPQSDTATVNVTVTEVNDTPTANTDAKTAVEDTPLVFPAADLAANDSAGPLNENTQTLTVTAVVSATTAQGGTVSLNAGNITYTPPPNYFGADSFQYTVTDNGTTNGGADPKSANGTVNVTVTEVNDAPTANDDAKNATEDTPLVFPASDLTGNDSAGPLEGTQTLTVTLVNSPTTQGGTVSLNAGNITYTPPPDYFGADSFTYTITDNGTTNGSAAPLTASATVNVTVSEVNDLPVAADDAKATAEDTPLVFPAADLAANDSAGPLNENTQTLTVTGVVSTTTAQGGTVSLNAGNITYTPPPDYFGADSFQYTVADNGTTSGSPDPQSDTATVNVTVTEVNDTPTANTDAKTAVEDTPLVFPAADLAANDSAGPLNENTQTLTVTAVVSATTAQGGTVSLNAGNITYTPPPNYFGADSFQYTVTDNGTTNGGADPKSANGTVNVTVTEVNDAPTANDDAKNATEDTPLVFPASDLTGNDSAGPLEGTQTLTVTLVNSPTTQGGTVSLNAGNITYTPPPDYFGADSFTYTITDNGTTNGSAAPLTASATVNVTVGAVNDAPVLTVTASPTPAFSEGGSAVNAATSVNITDADDTNIESASVSITSGFTTGDELVFSDQNGISGAYNSGTGVLLLTGTSSIGNYITALASITFRNMTDNPGTATRQISWVVNDGDSPSNGQTTNVTVSAVNDPPVLTAPASVNATEDTQFSFTAGNAISVTDADSGAGTNFQATLSSAAGSQINVTAAGAANVLGNNTNSVTITGTVADVNATLATVKYTGALDASGTDTLVVAVNDNGQTDGAAEGDTENITINIAATNDAPVNGFPALTQTFNEDTSLVFNNANGNALSVSDVDAGAGDLTVNLVTTAGNITLGTTAGLTSFSGNGSGNVMATGTIAALNTALQGTTFTPTLNLSGAQTITMSTTDNGNTPAPPATDNGDVINLSITAVNDAPVNVLPASPSVDQDTFLTMTVAGSTAIQITDVDAGAGTIQVALTASNGTMTLDGTTGLTFSFSDANGTGSGDGTADASMTLRGTLSDVNAALDGMTFTPTPAFFGAASIEVDTNDLGNSGSGGPQTDVDDVLAITVNQLNQPPVNAFPAGTQTFNEDTTLTFNGNVSISDPDAGVATVQMQLVATNGVLTLSATAGLNFVFTDGNGTGVGDGTNDPTMTFRGTIAAINAALNGMVYTPNLNYDGAATITLNTNDLGNTGPGGPKTDNGDVINLSITALNDAPVLSAPVSVNASEDVQFSFTAANTISVTDADSGAGMNFVATLSSAAGSQINVVAAGAAIVGGNDSNSVTITGTVADVNSTLATTKYTSALNANGTDTLAVNVTDNGQTGTGPVGTDSENITINIAAVNDAPVNTFPGATQTFNEDTTLTFSTANGNTLSVSDVDAASGNVTVTLSTTAGTLAFGMVTGLSAVTNNAATITGTGTLTDINNALQGVVFTPTLNINGPQTITMSTSDNGNTGSGGTQTDNGDVINLSITSVNDAPDVTAPANVTATEDMAFVFNGGNLISVTDVDSGAGTNFVATIAVTNGTVTVTAGGSTVLGNGTANLTITGTVANVNATLGTASFTGNANFNNAVGSASMVVNVDDNGQTGTVGPDGLDSANIAISVTAVNDPPIAASPTLNGLSGVPLSYPAGTLSGTDPNDIEGGTTVTIDTVAGATALTNLASVTLNANGSFTVVPVAGAATGSFEYKVKDDGTPAPGVSSSGTGTVTLNLNGSLTYYVKAIPAGIQNCTLGNECTLATAVALIGANTNRRIFMSDNGSHTGPAPLNSDGWLIGQGVTGSSFSNVMGYDAAVAALPAGTTFVTAFPAINQAGLPTVTGGPVTAGTNSNIKGFHISVSGNNSGLVSTGKTGLAIALGTVATNNSTANQTYAVDLGTSSGTLFTFGNITAGGTGALSHGVRFSNTTSTTTVTFGTIGSTNGKAFESTGTGATNFTFGAITSTAGAAVTVGTSTGNFSFGNITSTTGAAVTTTSTGAGDFTFANVSSTTGTAVSVTTATGDFSFTRIDANGGAKGISVNSLTAPGTFIVNGTATTDGTGGTIQNATSRGAEFISSANITLKNMNFTNNGVGGADVNCADALGATNPLNSGFITGASCESNIHLVTATNVTLTNLNVTLGDAHGIAGIGVNGLTMSDMVVTGNGDMVGEDGVQLVNSSGIIAATTGTNIFRDNAANQFEAQNGSGSVTLNFTGAFFGLTNFPTTGAAEAPSPGSSTANSGLLVGASGSATMTANVNNSTFEENYANGYLGDTTGTAVLTSNIGNTTANTFTNNGVPLEIAGNSTGAMNFTISNNTFTNDTAVTGIFATSVITASRSGTGSVWTGTINNNNIGLAAAGSTYSGCYVSGCNGLELTDSATSSTNAYNVTADGNDIYHVQGGITSNIGGIAAGQPKTSLILINNIIGNPDAPPGGAATTAQGNAIHVNSATLNTETPQTCVQISGNNITGAWGQISGGPAPGGVGNFDSIRLRHRSNNAGATFRVRNWDTTVNYDAAGATGDAADLMAYLETVNTITVPANYSKTGFQLTAGRTFTGGTAACP